MMCSIMGYCKANVSRELFEQAFAKTLSRGPDDTRIMDTGEGLLGFTVWLSWGSTKTGCSRL